MIDTPKKIRDWCSQSLISCKIKLNDRLLSNDFSHFFDDGRHLNEVLIGKHQVCLIVLNLFFNVQAHYTQPQGLSDRQR